MFDLALCDHLSGNKVLAMEDERDQLLLAGFQMSMHWQDIKNLQKESQHQFNPPYYCHIIHFSAPRFKIIRTPIAVLGFNIGSHNSVCSLHVLPVYVWVSPGTLVWLLPTFQKYVH